MCCKKGTGTCCTNLDIREFVVNYAFLKPLAYPAYAPNPWELNPVSNSGCKLSCQIKKNPVIGAWKEFCIVVERYFWNWQPKAMFFSIEYRYCADQFRTLELEIWLFQVIYKLSVSIILFTFQ